MTTKNTKTPAKLADILTAHKEWLNTRYDGAPKGRRADLTGADLAGAVLTGAVLRGADLRDADLTGADLRGAVLRDAVLTGADLRGAVLRGAVLTGADLRGAVLRGAVLTGAVLRGAVLRGAVLRGADLAGAVLRGADLRDAVLRDGYTRWEEYKKEVVPALCMAGGRSLDEVANPETWACHRWGSDGKAMGCPMATAFNVKAVAEIPAMYRQLANDFIQLFDQHLIPLAEVNPTYAESAK